jgi:heme-degrading monooxygenase HmoA
MNHVTLINAFEVPAGKEEEFVERWKQAAEHLRQREGFVSTRLHQSLDPQADFQFINVAVWESAEHFRQAMGTPEFQELARRMRFSSHPALYRVISE